jgi:hypothetical protein
MPGGAVGGGGGGGRSWPAVRSPKGRAKRNPGWTTNPSQGGWSGRPRAPGRSCRCPRSPSRCPLAGEDRGRRPLSERDAAPVARPVRHLPQPPRQLPPEARLVARVLRADAERSRRARPASTTAPSLSRHSSATPALPASQLGEPRQRGTHHRRPGAGEVLDRTFQQSLRVHPPAPPQVHRPVLGSAEREHVAASVALGELRDAV